jgi:hypothetical protein
MASTTIREEQIILRDVTVDNVSTSKHGFAPKSPGTSNVYLDGTGNYSTPSGATLGKVIMAQRNRLFTLFTS